MIAPPGRLCRNHQSASEHVDEPGDALIFAVSPFTSRPEWAPSSTPGTAATRRPNGSSASLSACGPCSSQARPVSHRAIASALVDDDGVEIIEPYRGIGPTAIAEVIETVGDRVCSRSFPQEALGWGTRLAATKLFVAAVCQTSS